jgi:hypothetical protein
MVSQWVFWRQANNFSPDPSITSSSAWRLQSSLDDCVDDRGYWAVNEITFYSDPDCEKIMLDTKTETSALASSYYDDTFIPYKAFDSDPKTNWFNEDTENDGGFIIGWDFGQDVTVMCVVLDQSDKEYVVKKVILEARDAEGMWKPVIKSQKLKTGKNAIRNTVTTDPKTPEPTSSPTTSTCAGSGQQCEESAECCNNLVCPHRKCRHCRKKKKKCRKHHECCSRFCNRRKGICQDNVKRWSTHEEKKRKATAASASMLLLPLP